MKRQCAITSRGLDFQHINNSHEGFVVLAFFKFVFFKNLIYLCTDLMMRIFMKWMIFSTRLVCRWAGDCRWRDPETINGNRLLEPTMTSVQLENLFHFLENCLWNLPTIYKKYSANFEAVNWLKLFMNKYLKYDLKACSQCSNTIRSKGWSYHEFLSTLSLVFEGYESFLDSTYTNIRIKQAYGSGSVNPMNSRVFFEKNKIKVEHRFEFVVWFTAGLRNQRWIMVLTC